MASGTHEGTDAPVDSLYERVQIWVLFFFKGTE